MSEDRTRINVDIYGSQYKITADGNTSPSYVKRIAAEVNDQMSQIAKTNNRLDGQRIAVLTAFHVVDQNLRLASEIDPLQRAKNASQQQSEQLQAQLSALQVEYNEIKSNQDTQLATQKEQYESELQTLQIERDTTIDKLTGEHAAALKILTEERDASLQMIDEVREEAIQEERQRLETEYERKLSELDSRMQSERKHQEVNLHSLQEQCEKLESELKQAQEEQELLFIQAQEEQDRLLTQAQEEQDRLLTEAQEKQDRLSAEGQAKLEASLQKLREKHALDLQAEQDKQEVLSKQNEDLTLELLEAQDTLATDLNKLQEKYKLELQQVKTEHGTMTKLLEEEHLAFILQLREEHAVAVKDQSTSHDKMVEELQSTSELALVEQRSQYEAALDEEKATRIEVLEEQQSNHEAALLDQEVRYASELADKQSQHAQTLEAIQLKHRSEQEQLRNLQEQLDQQTQAEANIHNRYEKEMERLKLEHDVAIRHQRDQQEGTVRKIREQNRLELMQAGEQYQAELIQAREEAEVAQAELLADIKNLQEIRQRNAEEHTRALAAQQADYDDRDGTLLKQHEAELADLTAKADRFELELVELQEENHALKREKEASLSEQDNLSAASYTAQRLLDQALTQLEAERESARQIAGERDAACKQLESLVEVSGHAAAEFSAIDKRLNDQQLAFDKVLRQSIQKDEEIEKLRDSLRTSFKQVSASKEDDTELVQVKHDYNKLMGEYTKLQTEYNEWIELVMSQEGKEK
ncbi:cell division protein ZapA [Paenibacillus sp. N1-5-1-14]|uniref:cell division protein ZapA n=1 Tax=Paenibacillus radicibacter TaxID=2972488 RepID=UPI002158E36B|nr:cell division protein ZapA [Paenibacillus radicibacter]MCR8644917.1 cell division protein ZapA [Paenibacillus radicibacter]